MEDFRAFDLREYFAASRRAPNLYQFMASDAGEAPGRAATMSPYPPQYRVPAEPPSASTPQYSLGPMATSRRTMVRPSRSSTVRCSPAPSLTKAVDKVRRPSASAGESARGAEAGPFAPDWLGSRMAASLGGESQAASAALHVSKRQSITPFARLNTALATRTGPSSHRASGAHRRDRAGAEAAAGTHPFHSGKLKGRPVRPRHTEGYR